MTNLFLTLHAQRGNFCSQCEICFSSNLTLRRHIESIHKGIVYACKKCGKTLKNYSSLLRHVKNHNKQNQLTCQECQKEFGRKEHLKKTFIFLPC